MRGTKIICTMGPNTDDGKMMKKLAKAGMDIARFNFSHGDHDEQKGRMDLLKKVREEINKPIAMLLDTKGPEIRTGRLKDETAVELCDGQEFTLTTKNIEGDKTICSQSYEKLPEDVKMGDKILIDDGLIGLCVKATTKTDIICTVESGGTLGERKGINVPNVSVNLPHLTQRDIGDIIFGISQGIDFVAASFVRNAEAVEEIRELLIKHNAKNVGIIAKIENMEGVDNIESIVKVADGIMVARGDLGVEVPAWNVPHMQKEIIRICNEHYKPVITATQMLDSMMRNPRPTRAEVTDVANAIYDGTDAIMLSGETAMGKYPVEAVQMMVEIATSSEPYINYERFLDYKSLQGEGNVSGAVGIAAVSSSIHLKAKCIVTPTVSGITARLISNFRPKVPIYAVTPNPWAQRKMQILWGVTPIAGFEEDSTKDIMSHAMSVVKREKYIEEGDLVVLTAGDPATNVVTGQGAVTNMMHIVQAR